MGEERGRNFGIVLLLTRVAAVVAFPRLGDDTGLNLSCTNDFSSRINCHVELHDCREHQLTVQSNHWPDQQNCSLRQCNLGHCCCSVEMMLTLGDSHTVTVWRDGRSLDSKKFGVKESVKPKTPTIVSVKESNGNFEVLWSTNMMGLAQESLTTEVTYYKASDVKKERVMAKKVTVSELSYHKILGQLLEPSMTYKVSVRSISNWSGEMSDSSNEFEFKTSALSDSLLIVIIISLSMAILIVSGTIYICFEKLKIEYCDPATKFPNPKLAVMHSSEQEVLRPVPAIISSVSVDPIITDENQQWSKTSVLDSSGGSLQHSSGISTGSSYVNTEPTNITTCVQDALRKIFPNIHPILQLTSTLKEQNDSSGLSSTTSDQWDGPTNERSYVLSGLVNKSYLLLLPHHNDGDSPEVRTQTEMLSESTHNGTHVLKDPNQQPVPVHQLTANQGFIFASEVSTLVESNMPYQSHHTESGAFSEDFIFSSLCSGTNTTMSTDLKSRDDGGCGIAGEVIGSTARLSRINELAILRDTNSCKSFTPATLQNGFVMDDVYQPFQNLLGQHDGVRLEPTCVCPDEHLAQRNNELTEIPQTLFGPTDEGFIQNDQGSQTPLLQILPADCSPTVVVDSDYHPV